MFDRVYHCSLFSALVVIILSAASASADILVPVASQSGQGANDSVMWSQLGVDQTVLPSSLSATSVGSKTVSVTLTASNSIVSVDCAASPCSWGGFGFTPGQSLLWTSDAGNGGNGPVTLAFNDSVAGAGALIQADEPGQFTAKLEAFNGATSLGFITVPSDSEGDAVYIGLQDQTGASITSVTFSLTSCGSGDPNCNLTDFALGTVYFNTVPFLPAVTFAPPSVFLGTEPVGTSSPTQMVTLTNTGNAPLTINNYTISGANFGDFILGTSTCGGSLPAGNSCDFPIHFTPSGPSPRKAVLMLNDSAPNSPHTVALTGIGITATVSPDILPFGSQAVGTPSAPQMITVINTGSATMNFWEIAILGANAGDFSYTTTCGTTLDPGFNCTVSVTFTPTATGARTAAVLFSDDAGGSPQSVSLTGTGI